jgi:hypothetical protein
VFNEYEILLPPKGKLVSINKCHPKYNIPIFVYFFDETAAQYFINSQQKQQTYRPYVNPPVIKQMPEATLETNQSMNNKQTWSEWLNNLIKQSEMPPDEVDYMDAVSSAYGGKPKHKKSQIKKTQIKKSQIKKSQIKKSQIKKTKIKTKKNIRRKHGKTKKIR